MEPNTVLVTGGAKGIGAAIAEKFAHLGYNVLINYNTSKNKAVNLKNKLIKEGYQVDIFKADVSKREEVNKMIEYCIETFGTIDVLVNNAGIAEYKLFTDLTQEDIKNMVDTTIIGTFNVTQQVLKKCMLNKKQGSIINISSIWGMVGASCEVNYSTSKAAIIGMTKGLAKELGPSNIRVNAVAPGIIATCMIDDFTQEDLEAFKNQIPLNKIGTVEEVASVVSFLASNEASYITGQIISPNGGVVM